MDGARVSVDEFCALSPRVESSVMTDESASEAASLISWAAEPDGLSRMVDFFLLARLEMGSRKMVLERGGASKPTSSCSTRVTFLSQFDVGAMVVGLVSVAVMAYEMVPRSN
jgi:hypothetical protein